MKLKELIKSQALHVGLLPVLFVANHYFTIVAPRSVGNYPHFIWWVLNLLGALTLLISVAWVIYKLLAARVDRVKAGIITTLLLFPLLFMQDIFYSTSILFTDGLRTRWLVILTTVLISGSVYGLATSRKSFHRLNEFLNVLVASLIVATLITLAISWNDFRPKPIGYKADNVKLTCAQCPDIYLIILDSYTSNESLLRYFSFDNSKFSDSLKSLGFEIDNSSKALVDKTFHSLASTLNMGTRFDFLPYKNRPELQEIIRRSTVIQALEQKGYLINNLSLLDIGNQPKYYSTFPHTHVGFIDGIAESSMFYVAVFSFARKLEMYDLHLSILARIAEVARAESSLPRFVYGHIMAPHPPFVLDSSGGEIGFFRQARNEGSVEGFVNQTKGINQLTLELVTDLMKRTPEAIVIIMGDHGYRFILGSPEEGFTTFLAYHGPAQQEAKTLEYSNDIFKLVFREIEQTVAVIGQLNGLNW